jgi:hypothetical protein
MVSLSPGLLTSLSSGPPVADVQRNYLFTATLFKVDWAGSLESASYLPDLDTATTVINGAKKFLLPYKYLNPLTMIPNLLYISGLIKEVEQPQQNIICEDRQFGSLTVQVPKSVSMDSFQVTFVEEIIGSVEFFYRNFFLEATGGSNLTFRELKKLSLSLLFTREATGIAPGVSTPVNVYYYPHVIPIAYEIDPWDKSGEGFVTSRVTFIRIPEMPSANDLTNGWNSQQVFQGLAHGIFTG